MALNNTTADALATAIVSAVGGDSVSLANWKLICRQIYSALKTDAVVVATVASVSGVTPGGGVSGPGAASGTLT